MTVDLSADVDILITYLDLWASANYAMSDKFNLWIGPMFGIHLDDKIKIMGIDITQGQTADFESIVENDFGIVLGAGYSISENIKHERWLISWIKRS